MAKRMKLASYRTEAGAAKYAAEIMKKFPSLKAEPAVQSDFSYGVKIITKDGHSAMALRRPRNYHLTGYTAIMQGKYRVPNDGDL